MAADSSISQEKQWIMPSYWIQKNMTCYSLQTLNYGCTTVSFCMEDFMTSRIKMSLIIKVPATDELRSWRGLKNRYNWVYEIIYEAQYLMIAHIFEELN